MVPEAGQEQYVAARGARPAILWQTLHEFFIGGASLLVVLYCVCLVAGGAGGSFCAADVRTSLASQLSSACFSDQNLLEGFRRASSIKRQLRSCIPSVLHPLPNPGFRSLPASQSAQPDTCKTCGRIAPQMAHRLLLLAGAATALIAPPTRQSPRASALQAKKTVFIDGEAGTTGLQVLDRLATHPDIEVLSIDPAKRKDAAARKDAIAQADAVVLCLPDDAAREAVALAEGTDTKIVDASTAHRIDDAWVYGFPELDAAQRGKIASSTRVANPGCYATGFIAVTRPLVDAGLLKPEARLACSAVSGYSGGGKQAYGRV